MQHLNVHLFFLPPPTQVAVCVYNTVTTSLSLQSICWYPVSLNYLPWLIFWFLVALNHLPCNLFSNLFFCQTNMSRNCMFILSLPLKKLCLCQARFVGGNFSLKMRIYCLSHVSSHQVVNKKGYQPLDLLPPPLGTLALIYLPMYLRFLLHPFVS